MLSENSSRLVRLLRLAHVEPSTEAKDAASWGKLHVHESLTEDEIKDIPLQAAAKFLNSKPHGGNALEKEKLACVGI